MVEDGSWRITGSSETTSPEQPAPSPGADDWQCVLAADINADGITEQIAYRPAAITLQGPVGFADPWIVEVLIAQELVVSQEVSPGGRTRLHLTGAELRADAQLRATFDDVDEPAAGFLVVVVYGGERYSYHITPLTSDSTLSLPGMEAIWSQLEHGYRRP